MTVERRKTAPTLAAIATAGLFVLLALAFGGGTLGASGAHPTGGVPAHHAAVYQQVGHVEPTTAAPRSAMDATALRLVPGGSVDAGVVSAVTFAFLGLAAATVPRASVLGRSRRRPVRAPPATSPL
ncbi:MAG: hypothetical protein ACRDN9_20475 [Streptosporangiaceae bacterium]